MDQDQADRIKAWAHSARSLSDEISAIVTGSDESLADNRCPLIT